MGRIMVCIAPPSVLLVPTRDERLEARQLARQIKQRDRIPTCPPCRSLECMLATRYRHGWVRTGRVNPHHTLHVACRQELLLRAGQIHRCQWREHASWPATVRRRRAHNLQPRIAFCLMQIEDVDQSIHPTGDQTCAPH